MDIRQSEIPLPVESASPNIFGQQAENVPPEIKEDLLGIARSVEKIYQENPPLPYHNFEGYIVPTCRTAHDIFWTMKNTKGNLTLENYRQLMIAAMFHNISMISRHHLESAEIAAQSLTNIISPEEISAIQKLIRATHQENPTNELVKMFQAADNISQMADPKYLSKLELLRKEFLFLSPSFFSKSGS